MIWGANRGREAQRKCPAGMTGSLVEPCRESERQQPRGPVRWSSHPVASSLFRSEERKRVGPMKFVFAALALALAGCTVEQPVVVADPLQSVIEHERGVELGVLRARADEARFEERQSRLAEIHHQQQRDDADFATRLMMATPKPTVIVTPVREVR